MIGTANIWLFIRTYVDAHHSTGLDGGDTTIVSHTSLQKEGTGSTELFGILPELEYGSVTVVV